MTRWNRLLGCVAVGVTSSCATSPVRQHSIAISAADAQARQALAAEAAIDPAKIPARAFAVLPFATTAHDSLLEPLGYALSDLLIDDLAQSRDLHLVERQHTDAILRELDLVDAGVTDPRGAPRVGLLVGARRLLIGTLTSGSDRSVILSARVVDVIAGTVQPLVSGSAPLARIIDAEKALAFRVFDELGVALTPAQRLAVEQRQSTNFAATLAYGRGVRADVRGDSLGAVRGFEEAVRLDASFAAARAQLASAGAHGTTRDSRELRRVLDLSSNAINAPVSSRLPEAADVPLQANLITLLILVRVF